MTTIAKTYKTALYILFALTCLTTRGGQTGSLNRVRIGPFFEYGQNEAGKHTFALRPLFSRVTTVDATNSTTEILWPISSFSNLNDHFRWRVAMAFGSDSDLKDDSSRYSFWVLPLYTQGRSFEGCSYRAIFPVYGKMVRLFDMEDIYFCMFPLYGRYRTSKGDTRQYAPWPFYRRSTNDKTDDARHSFFPFYGTHDTNRQNNKYILWPFWTEQEFIQEGNHGYAKMLFPVYAVTSTEKQHGWMAIPPFIGYSEMPGKNASRLRAPWPFVLIDHGPMERRAFWPVWGKKDTDGNRHSWYAIWPFLGGYGQELPGQTFKSRYLVPFYYSASRQLSDKKGVSESRYSRIWPLYSYRRQNEDAMLRIADLWPIQHGDAVERNWAPFWTLYTHKTRGESTENEILWGLAKWGHDYNGTTYGSIAGIFSWKCKKRYNEDLCSDSCEISDTPMNADTDKGATDDNP